MTKSSSRAAADVVAALFAAVATRADAEAISAARNLTNKSQVISSTNLTNQTAVNSMKSIRKMPPSVIGSMCKMRPGKEEDQQYRVSNETADIQYGV